MADGQSVHHGEDAGDVTSDLTYFTSYADLEVHELMLKDEARTRAYQQYIEENRALFTDKIVVDIGAGTGILSMFAAKAGAKQVFAIEASNISSLCSEIIAQNQLQEKITVLHGRAEDVKLPDGIKADILISEWMGFYLLHESMLCSVLTARDKFLKPDGVMVPAVANLYLCPVTMPKFYNDKFEFWKKAYGLDLSPAIPHVQNKVFKSPQVESLSPEQCLAEPEVVMNLVLQYVEQEEVQKVCRNMKFSLTKNSILHGFACWFDVEFEGDVPKTLDTGPHSESTHWKQTVVLLPEPLMVSKAEEVCCLFNLRQSEENPRRYNIGIEIPEEECDEDEEGDEGEEGVEEELNQSQQIIIEAMQKASESKSS